MVKIKKDAPFQNTTQYRYQKIHTGGSLKYADNTVKVNTGLANKNSGESKTVNLPYLRKTTQFSAGCQMLYAWQKLLPNLRRKKYTRPKGHEEKQMKDDYRMRTNGLTKTDEKNQGYFQLRSAEKSGKCRMCQLVSHYDKLRVDDGDTRGSTKQPEIGRKHPPRNKTYTRPIVENSKLPKSKVPERNVNFNFPVSNCKVAKTTVSVRLVKFGIPGRHRGQMPRPCGQELQTPFTMSENPSRSHVVVPNHSDMSRHVGRWYSSRRVKSGRSDYPKRKVFGSTYSLTQAQDRYLFCPPEFRLCANFAVRWWRLWNRKIKTTSEVSEVEGVINNQI